MKTLKLLTIIGLAFAATSLHAIEPLLQHSNSQHNAEKYAWINSSNNNFIVNVPSLNLSEVEEQMHIIQSNLTARKDKLILAVKNSVFTLTDSLITLVLPGGILYAAALKSTQIQVKNELLQVSSQLNEITHEISNLTIQRKQSTNIIIAQK